MLFDMSKQQMITFRCPWELYERLENFAIERNIDRTSAIKLAVHYYLNLLEFRAANPELAASDPSTSELATLEHVIRELATSDPVTPESVTSESATPELAPSPEVSSPEQ